MGSTGDIVKAIVPEGKYKGTWTGALACRKKWIFDIKNKEGVRIAQGINHKHCKVLSRVDGYEYTTECLKVDGILLMTKVTSILPWET
ncbi:hypothetical protein [Methanosarcina horonobensis]|uniref:hypothetical protein n=1 Tax=Methanosarcina horonobensis TaxID=418008 RepID=UPI000B0192A4|nr:hypothetical protein [Methanosarcina horonobensis]